jgi:hypothetical protein
MNNAYKMLDDNFSVTSVTSVNSYLDDHHPNDQSMELNVQRSIDTTYSLDKILKSKSLDVNQHLYLPKKDVSIDEWRFQGILSGNREHSSRFHSHEQDQTSTTPTPPKLTDTMRLFPKKKEENAWRTAVCPNTKRTYYYNINTRETKWTKPIELSTPEERRQIEEKEKAQRDFFASMELNMLSALQSGQIPGSQSPEDQVKPLPIPGHISRMRSAPKLVRTISSMDDELLAELTQKLSVSDDHIPSPDSVSNSSLFASLPQPPGLTKNASKAKSLVSPSSPGSIASSSIPKPELGKRNTCGTMYVDNTMSAPDKEAAIRCLCGVYRTHILQSFRSDTTITKFDDYEVFNDDYSSTTIKKSGLTSMRWVGNSDTSSAVDLDQGKSNFEIPSLDEITLFYRFIFNKAQLESDCIIMSLIYVEKLIKDTNGGVRPTVKNWKSVLFSCMILSSKVWDDLSMWNVDFTQACPSGVSFTLQRINQLELALLNALKYNVKVPASEYAKYYFLMRSMMIRSGLAGPEVTKSSPLDLESAQKLEVLSSKFKDTVQHKRSRSIGDADYSTSTPSSRGIHLEQVVQL